MRSLQMAVKKIEPYVIDRIIDRAGKILFKKQVRRNTASNRLQDSLHYHGYFKRSSCRGTAKKISALNRKDFAGKTGTTNKAESTWFTGYNEKIVTSVWMGFDQPKSLGDREFGSSTALPIWMDYKKEIIDLIPITNTMPPKGLSIVKIDRVSGGLASDESSDPIFEYFLEENLPN